MPSYPTVQSVGRALRILRELNQHASSSVDMLHRATGLPKPTVVRLLETLVAAGYVDHDIHRGWYRVTGLVQSLSCGFHGVPAVVEAASPVLLALTKRFKWSIAIAVLDRDALVIRYRTNSFSPIAVYHSSLNMRVSLTTRAFGLAYIAFCPRAERLLLLKLIGEREGQKRSYGGDLDTILDRIQANGFAERHGSLEDDAGPELKLSSTVAVPIMTEDRVIATIGMTYYTSAVTRKQAVADYVNPLRDAACEIARRVTDTPPALGQVPVARAG